MTNQAKASRGTRRPALHVSARAASASTATQMASAGPTRVSWSRASAESPRRAACQSSVLRGGRVRPSRGNRLRGLAAPSGLVREGVGECRHGKYFIMQSTFAQEWPFGHVRARG